MAGIVDDFPPSDFDDLEGLLCSGEPPVPALHISFPQTALPDVPITPLMSPTYLMSEPDFTLDQSTKAEDYQGEAKPTAGRRKKEITHILAAFQHIKPTRHKVKKEYLRIALLRGFKRAIRDVIDEVVPRKKIHGFAKDDLKAAENWSIFCLFVQKNRFLETLAPTKAGPRSEGKASKAEAKTFNDQFCLAFFSKSLIRASFRLYLNVIFSHQAPKDLSKRFKFEAIGLQEEQMESWKRLKGYLYCGMFRELEIVDEWREEDEV